MSIDEKLVVHRQSFLRFSLGQLTASWFWKWLGYRLYDKGRGGFRLTAKGERVAVIARFRLRGEAVKLSVRASPRSELEEGLRTA